MYLESRRCDKKWSCNTLQVFLGLGLKDLHDNHCKETNVYAEISTKNCEKLQETDPSRSLSKGPRTDVKFALDFVASTRFCLILQGFRSCPDQCTVL